MSRSLYSLRQAKNFLGENALKTLYFSLIHCHLTYASIIWSSCTTTTLKVLVTKQKMAIRAISGAKFNAHTEPLFKSLNILPLTKLLTLHQAEFMYSYVSNSMPVALAGSWPTVQERRQQEDREENHMRTLRNDNDLYIPLCSSSLAEKLPLITLPKVWNDLCISLKQCESKIIFKTKTKFFLLDQLTAIASCNRLFCPSCALPPT
jgi:hypothetical protein